MCRLGPPCQGQGLVRSNQLLAAKTCSGAMASRRPCSRAARCPPSVAHICWHHCQLAGHVRCRSTSAPSQAGMVLLPTCGLSWVVQESRRSAARRTTSGPGSQRSVAYAHRPLATACDAGGAWELGSSGFGWQTPPSARWQAAVSLVQGELAPVGWLRAAGPAASARWPPAGCAARAAARCLPSPAWSAPTGSWRPSEPSTPAPQASR